MFSAYSGEGYHASMEAKVEEFLADETENISEDLHILFQLALTQCF